MTVPGAAGARLTVVIPTHERRAVVERAVRHLADQVGPPPFEVVAVVDGSTDGTAQALAALDVPFPVRVVEQPNRGLAAARNRGAAEAATDVLLFLDDDMVPGPRFLAEMAGAVDAGAGVVVPRITIGDWVPDTLLTRLARQWEEEAAAALAAGRRRFDDLRFCAHAVRRDLFEAAGRFDESFTAEGGYGNEDLDLGRRLLDRSPVVEFRPGAVVATDVELDARTALRRWRAVGRSDVRLAAKHPDLADRLFAARVRRSRAHRLAADLVRDSPGAARLLLLVGEAVAEPVTRRPGGWLRRAMWSVLTAVGYWCGVADAGGIPPGRVE